MDDLIKVRSFNLEFEVLIGFVFRFSEYFILVYKIKLYIKVNNF